MSVIVPVLDEMVFVVVELVVVVDAVEELLGLMVLLILHQEKLWSVPVCLCAIPLIRFE
jgi:hypothetical protein